jgi:hypothetical protein
MRLPHRPILLLLLAAGACDRPVEGLDDRFAEAAGAGRAVRGSIAGRPVAVLVEDCRVYDLSGPADWRGRRTAVLTPDPYPSYTVCERQSARLDAAYVTVTLGRMAFGAGGCCATGGTNRSRDGRRWEREVGAGRWTPVLDGAVGAADGDTTRAADGRAAARAAPADPLEAPR